MHKTDGQRRGKTEADYDKCAWYSDSLAFIRYLMDALPDGLATQRTGTHQWAVAGLFFYPQKISAETSTVL